MYHVTLVVCPCWAVSSVGLLSHPADASRQILFLKKKDANPFFLLPSPLAEAQGNTKKMYKYMEKNDEVHVRSPGLHDPALPAVSRTS